MSVQEILLKIKSAGQGGVLFALALGIAVSGASFGLGRLSATGFHLEKVTLTPQPATPVSYTYTESTSTTTSTAPETPAPATEGKYVASKKGKKYHLPWCSGAQRIAPENKIWFQSKEEAEKNGYTKAGNCKGL